MGLFSWFGDFFDSDIGSAITDDTLCGGGPSVNIDGSPMLDGIDIHGHPFGVTDDAFGNSGIGCDDIFSNGCSISDDMFSSIGSSSFDDPFS